jgi:hypothetical protein
VDLVSFQTRQIGLYEGEQVPVIVGGKVDGRIGRTTFGGMAVHTDEVDSLGVPVTTMGALRVRQDVLSESSVGVLGTFGDPLGRPDSWLGGVDFTYQTSRLGGDKNFLIGVYGLMTGREGLGGDRSAVGGKFDYPNDRWDFALSWKRIGDGFDPSLGFVPRTGVWIVSAGARHRLRSPAPWLRSVVFEALPSVFTDLHGNRESYKVNLTPYDWMLESGDRFQATFIPEGEVLAEPFEISDGVTIPVGEYHWSRVRAEVSTAPKRAVSGSASWSGGGFYDGTLQQVALRLLVQPSAVGSLELTAERNAGDLPEGNFTQDLASARLRINFSPDLQLNGLVQYDNVTNTIGANTGSGGASVRTATSSRSTTTTLPAGSRTAPGPSSWGSCCSRPSTPSASSSRYRTAKVSEAHFDS